MYPQEGTKRGTFSARLRRVRWTHVVTYTNMQKPHTISSVMTYYSSSKVMVVTIYMNATVFQCKYFTCRLLSTHTLTQKYACAAGLGRSDRLMSSDSFRLVDGANINTHAQHMHNRMKSYQPTHKYSVISKW